MMIFLFKFFNLTIIIISYSCIIYFLYYFDLFFFLQFFDHLLEIKTFFSPWLFDFLSWDYYNRYNHLLFCAALKFIIISNLLLANSTSNIIYLKTLPRINYRTRSVICIQYSASIWIIFLLFMPKLISFWSLYFLNCIVLP